MPALSRTVSRCALSLLPLAALQIASIGPAIGAEQTAPAKVAPSAVQPAAPAARISPRAGAVRKTPVASAEAVAIQQYGKVKITSLEVPWPPADCKATASWRAEVTNNNPGTVSQLYLEGWQYLENQQRWYLVGSAGTFSVDGNQTRTLEGHWNPGSGVSRYKVVLRLEGKTLAKHEERVQNLAIPATTDLEIQQAEFNGDNWKVTLKNNSTVPECALSVQTYLVNRGSGTSVPTGGLGAKVPANGARTVQNTLDNPPANWQANYDEFKVMLMRAPTWEATAGPGWTAIKTQSFPLQ